MQDDLLREFYDIGKSLMLEKDTLKLFDKILHSSMRLTSADAGTIYLVLDKKTGEWSSIKNQSCRGKLLKFVIARNTSMNINLQESISPISTSSIFGYSVISGKSLRIDDAYRINEDVEYRHNSHFDTATGYVTRSMLSIPMKNHDNHVMGVIQLINKKKAGDLLIDYSDPEALKQIVSFDDIDELIMNSLAGQATIALENNLLYRDMEKLLQDYKQQNSRLVSLSKQIMQAHEEERKRIAREIHDGPAQSAVNLSLKLEICKRYLKDDKLDRMSEEMNLLGGTIQSIVREIRTIIYDLKPTSLEDGLINAIESYIKIYSDQTGIPVHFTHRGKDTRIEYYMTSTLYRIVQEALSNANKHAAATQIRIHLVIAADSLNLSITDNGKGFDVEGLKNRKFDRLKGGFGLEGIRERVELVSGRLAIQSAPGKGTTLSITLPLS